MYGWLEVDDFGKTIRVACKEPISNTQINGHAVIGAFSFRIAPTFFKCVETRIEKNRRINNEYYVDVALDECILSGSIVRPMEVRSYVCWGTPQDLEKYRKI